MGRPRLPIKLHQERGTYREDRHGPVEAIPKPTAVRPSGMTRQEAWLWDSVASMQPIDEAAAPLLWSMCELWGMYRKAIEAAKLDPVDKDTRIAVKEYWHAFSRAAQAFGLGPADRNKLRLPDKPKEQDKEGKARFFA